MPWQMVTFTRQDVIADRVSAMLMDYQAALMADPRQDAAIFCRDYEDYSTTCYFSPDAVEVFSPQLVAMGATNCEPPARGNGLDMVAGDERFAWPQVPD